MIFGNMGQTSGTGVAFTRNPSTGENKLFGEFLMNAQGEDVVAGIRTPEDISSLKNIMPKVYDEFMKITSILENHYKDMQDIEFTIENEKLYILQTRNGKRTANASINIVVDLVNEKIIDEKEATLRIDPKQLDQLLHPSFDSGELKKAKVIAKGLPASPGASSGQVYFNSQDILNSSSKNEDTILVRVETSPEDIEGMVNSQGILTARGGMTSHAAVVARGMRKCCVVGCSEINIDEENKEIRINDILIKKGDYIFLDGSTGYVYLGKIKKDDIGLTDNFEKIMKWADKYKKIDVRTNADNPKDTSIAIKFGAQGIGLCRTEHMFFEEDRIALVRQMILSDSLNQRQQALEKLLPIQRKDFFEIFKVMDSKGVNIRLLDPLLHEFIPHDDETINNLSIDMNVSVRELKFRIKDLEEFNPMLGHRGCRLGITYPEIYIMQAKAIIQGVIDASELGVKVIPEIPEIPEIMIPLVGEVKELRILKGVIKENIDNVLLKENIKIDYTVGTMIEVPCACLTANKIAKEADYFSFGTNDLTQMTYGYSRDDSGKFLGDYINQGLLEKETNPNIKLGICGEHGGDLSSIAFFVKLGLNYISCSPFRVPIARLSAAQASIKYIEN